MAKSLAIVTFSLLLLSLALGLASSARILDQLEDPVVGDASGLPALPPVTGSADVPIGEAPAAPVDLPSPDDEVDQPSPNPNSAANAVTPNAPGGEVDQPQPQPQPNPNPAGGGSEHPAISFFMHDILGGSQATCRIVTGIVATSNVNGIPFSKPNNQVFPVTNGVPLSNLNNMINNNNVPYLASLTGQRQQQSQTLIQNRGTNSVVNGGNNNNQAFVNPGQLPTGATLQQLMFGSVTVIDDELTEAQELGSGVIGRGQGFYLASSLDGGSHTMAFTAILHGGDQGHEEEADTISFFGVHRTASPISQIAVIGGTGKYENAKGYATIETLPQVDQHTTDGVDTIAQFNVFI